MIVTVDFHTGKVTSREPTPEEIAALPEPIPTPPPQFTSLEFLDLFTEAEQLAVVQATMVNAQVKLWYDKLLAAEYVDLEDVRTEQGIDALIAAGLILPARKSEILSAQ